MTRKETHTIQIDGPTLSLDDLRWLVDACKGMSGDSTVDVSRYSDQRDGDYRSISVNGKPVPKIGLHGGVCRTPLREERSDWPK